MPPRNTLPNVEGWTYGAEHELADWDTLVNLPPGFGRSHDHTIVNSNGIAVQPNTKVYRFGGEINTPPTSTVEEQVDCLLKIRETYQEASVNHRSNLHVHVRVPGLVHDLNKLKQIQRYVHTQLKPLLPTLEPIPPGATPAEHKRARRRKVSHQTFLTEQRLAFQLEASTVQEFFEREVPRSKSGKVMWHAQPRLAAGLRQLLQTDTVEFRHFPGTIDPDQLLTCLEWCREFMRFALASVKLAGLWERFGQRSWPSFPGFDEQREIRYQATAAHNGLTAEQIKKNIQTILEGRFHASSSEYQAAARKAGCV